MDNDLVKLFGELDKNYNILRQYKQHRHYHRVREVEYAYQIMLHETLSYVKKWKLTISDEVIECLFDIIKSCLYVWDDILECGFNNLDHIKRNIRKLEKIINRRENEKD